MPVQITENCKGCTVCVEVCPVGAISGAHRELHRVDARLCIDCDACGRVCPFKAVLSAHGTVIPFIHPRQRPIPVWDYRRCVACTICTSDCPTGAIGPFTQENAPHQAALPMLKEAQRCIHCAFCADRCPTGAIKMVV